MLILELIQPEYVPIRAEELRVFLRDHFKVEIDGVAVRSIVREAFGPVGGMEGLVVEYPLESVTQLISISCMNPGLFDRMEQVVQRVLERYKATLEKVGAPRKLTKDNCYKC